MIAPSSRLHPCRKPTIATTAMNSSEPSNDMVSWFSLYERTEISSVPQVLRRRGSLSHGAQVGAKRPEIGAHFGSHEMLETLSHFASASRSQVVTTPTTPAMPSAAA